jgi:uncharacterized membrane-anchored protein YitT (DUF2179 family)
MKYIAIYFQLTLGALLVALGVEVFLIPNNIVDGGVTAISIMLNAKLNLPVWMPFVILNTVCLLLTARAIGKEFIIRTIYANVIAAVGFRVFSSLEPITHSELLTVLYGGLSVGIGIALVIRNSAAIDGTEMIALWFHKHFHVPISTFLFTINAFIFTAAAFAFSPEKAMLSVATFIIVTKSIDFLLDGLNQAKSVIIVSNKPYEIGESLIKELDISITYLHGEGGFSKDEKRIIYCIVDKFIFPKLCELTLTIDPTAILEASFVSETVGFTKTTLLERFGLKK